MAVPARRIRIIAVPPGEAPWWVREQWVGLELPLAQMSGSPRSRRVFGVMSGPRDVIGQILAMLRGRSRREDGYAVRVADALLMLDGKSPEAAAWWRVNLPHVLQPGRCFVFAASACQALEESAERLLG